MLRITRWLAARRPVNRPLADTGRGAGDAWAGWRYLGRTDHGYPDVSPLPDPPMQDLPAAGRRP